MWQEILDNLNTIIQGSGVTVTAIATVVLAWLTARYVRLTNHMLEETKASRGPTVYVDLELSSYEVKLIVGNSGSAPAHNLSFEVEESIPWRESEYHKGIGGLPQITDGISYLAPSRILKFTAGWLDWDKLKDLDSKVSFQVNYDDHVGKHHKIEFIIDMGQYDGVLLESFKNPASEIAGAIRKIEDGRRSEKSMSQITSNMFKKNCPFCSEKISPNAKKCPHCLEFLPEEKEDA